MVDGRKSPWTRCCVEPCGAVAGASCPSEDYSQRRHFLFLWFHFSSGIDLVVAVWHFTCGLAWSASRSATLRSFSHSLSRLVCHSVGNFVIAIAAGVTKIFAILCLLVFGTKDLLLTATAIRIHYQDQASQCRHLQSNLRWFLPVKVGVCGTKN